MGKLLKMNWFVRTGGLEPPRISPPDPKSGAATITPRAPDFSVQIYHFLAKCAKKIVNFGAVKAESATLEDRLRNPQTRREAFAELISEFGKPLYWQIRRMVQSHEDADDLLQNTFMKAWTAMDDFRGEAKLSTWLHKVAINEALSFLDKRGRHSAESLDSAETGSLARALEADEWTDGDEVNALFRRAIATLPPKQQLVFNMKYFDDMKYEEIAEITGTSVGALKTSYHLAVKKIEKYLLDHH